MKQFGINESTWYVDSLDRQFWVSEGLMYFEEINTRNEESKRRNRKSSPVNKRAHSHLLLKLQYLSVLTVVVAGFLRVVIMPLY